MLLGHLHVATSLANAVDALADFGEAASPLAGGTWIMRAPIRNEQDDRQYVAIGQLTELNSVKVADDEIRLGAGLTHIRLATELATVDQCTGLRMAATGAANPAIRQMATLGGNISTWDFPAADLTPALLCLDAVVERRTRTGTEQLPIGRFLGLRQAMARNALVTSIILPRNSRRTGHARLPLRKAGYDPVAIVSIGCDLGPDGSIEDIRIAVGSVEATARRWTELEERLRGSAPDPRGAQAEAERASHTFAGRAGVEAPGWYRVKVLPALVRRAMQTIITAA